MEERIVYKSLVEKIKYQFENHGIHTGFDGIKFDWWRDIENEIKTLEQEKFDINSQRVQAEAENHYKDEILRIIKSFNCYTVEEIQGQWYLMMGTIVVKSPKIPISEETAMLLKEWLK